MLTCPNAMSNVKLELNEKKHGRFTVSGDEGQSGEMVVAVGDNGLVVYHTEVSDKLKGQGAGGKLLDAMVTHARQHQLKVVPLCPYVLAQFKRHTEQYAAVWNQDWHGKKS